jgi:outer membrane protein OmpA-like peptidoglycan-associated protein
MVYRFLILFILFSIYTSTMVAAFEGFAKPVKINLGDNVNTECNELLPIISPDDSTLYFTRENCDGNLGYQDIYVSRKLPDGGWGKAINIGAPLNNKYSNFVSAVTPDGNNLLLGNVYRMHGLPDKGVSISHMTSKGWSFPERVKIENYYNNNDYASFYLANDAKTLLMAIERDDSYGGKDLYVSFLRDNGVWSEPSNLGPFINSFDDELTPFLASDGETLYFSSHGHQGYGDADIFISRRLDNSWTKWTEPENLGDWINTPDWDANYKTSASGENAYFVSTENSLGKGDLFKVMIPDVYKPKPVMLVHGRVIDAKTRVPLDARIFYNMIETGQEMGQAESNPVTGEYQVILPGGASYVYRGESEGYFYASAKLDIKLLSAYDEVEQDLELIPISDSIICLRNIFFEKSKFVLTKESALQVQFVTKFLKENPDHLIRVEGHADSTGTHELNLRLSAKRAKTVARKIQNLGIASCRIKHLGRGEDFPVYTNDTEQGRQLNRRVEFYIYKP